MDTNTEIHLDDITRQVRTREEMMQLGFTDTQLKKQVRENTLSLLRTGIYISTDFWLNLPPWQRYQAEILAFHRKAEKPLFSHHSAASIYGLWLTQIPPKVHIYCWDKSRGSARGVSKHPFLTQATPVVQHSSGLLLTDVASTVRDLAKKLPHAQAVAVADSALALGYLNTAELRNFLLSYEGKSFMRVRRVAQDMSTLAGSPGESFTRLILAELGIRYEEQKRFDVDGRTYFVDFYLPDYGVVLEFDGRIKYGGFGRSAEETLLAERVRERALERCGVRIFRTDWQQVVQDELVFRTRLVEFLRSARLPHRKIQPGGMYFA